MAGGHLHHVDEGLAKRVADGLGMASLPPAPRLAAAVSDVAPSPALQIIGKMKQTLEGRVVGILVDDGSTATTIQALRKAIEREGATVKLVAPTLGVQPEGRKRVVAEGQPAGTPSVVFDAVAPVPGEEAGKRLAKDLAAVDFARDAFGHLKAIAASEGTQALLQAARVTKHDGVTAADDIKGFIAAAKTWQWQREPQLRKLA